MSKSINQVTKVESSAPQHLEMFQTEFKKYCTQDKKLP